MGMAMAEKTTRPRLVILDILRGLAGLSVLFLHLGELGDRHLAPKIGVTLPMNFFAHGYLAVEFFLLLMGFMFGYAYDRRWEKGMTFREFMYKRFVRLHPLIVSGTLIGLAVWLVNPDLGYWSASWCGFNKVSIGEGLLAALVTVTGLPYLGFSHFYPFNPCAWTIFYEYLANIFYGLCMRRFGKWVLLALALVSLYLLACSIYHVNAVSLLGLPGDWFRQSTQHYNTSIVAGPSLPKAWANWVSLYRALLRLAVPMFLGLFLARTGWKLKVSKPVAVAAVLVFLGVMCVPWEGGRGLPANIKWINPVFELTSLVVVFPVLLLIGVGTEVKNERVGRIAAFWGELSYPIYMTHFPLHYIYWGWVLKCADHFSYAVNLVIYFAVAAFLIAVSYLMMRYWDRPAQRWLLAVKGSGDSK